MKKLTNLLSSISFEQATPVNAVDIEEYERQLNLVFGKVYKLFLYKYGCIVAGANELYGVCGNNTSIPSAIHATLSARRNPHFPSTLLVIAEDGCGRKFCVDSNDDIYLCDLGTCKKTGQSFEDFAVEWLSS